MTKEYQAAAANRITSNRKGAVFFIVISRWIDYLLIVTPLGQ